MSNGGPAENATAFFSLSADVRELAPGG